MSDIDKTDWSPNRKIVAQAAAMLILFVTGAILTGAGHEFDIPLGIETAVAVVIGYFIPNNTRTVTTVESTQKTQVVKNEVPANTPDTDPADV